MNNPARLVPWAILAVAVFVLGVYMIPPSEMVDQLNLYEFGAVSVVDGGRLKPLDTFARTTLFAISDRQTYLDENETSQPAIKWVLDVASRRTLKGEKLPVAYEQKVFRITNDQVLSFLGLEARSGFRYSLHEIGSTREHSLEELQANAIRALKREANQRDLFELKVIELYKNVQAFNAIEAWRAPLMAPPEGDQTEWTAFRDAVTISKNGTIVPDSEHPAAASLKGVLEAYRANNAERFNEEVVAYKDQVGTTLSSTQKRQASFELFFNHFEPFYVCSILYLFVFLLACTSWVAWTETMRQSAFWLALLTLVVHTWALLARMYLNNRPMVFVTNLYSSAIFIGWGAAALGLFLEYLFRNTIGVLVSAVLGSLTLIVAHNIAVGDTLEMMQAVLDTNFWLATHVTSVTIGYTATFVAGFLGILFIIRGMFTRSLAGAEAKRMGQMIYGIVCFAMLFSFVGTVLGGIWADQSWGRFWGWDPKENGALLIVIWNALILHARWGGMVHQRGLAVLAVGGNVVTAWSWFGTNMLGVGLHAYGFMNGADRWLIAFVLAQLVMVGIGSLPLRMWTSFNEAPNSDAPPPPLPPAATTRKGRKGKHAPTAIQPA